MDNGERGRRLVAMAANRHKRPPPGEPVLSLDS